MLRSLPVEMERLQPWLLCGAFWVALAVGRRAGPRLIWGLALGALLAHAGWLLLHLDRWAAAISSPSLQALLADSGSTLIGAPGPHAPGPWWSALDPLRGHSLLFLPLGPVLVALARRRGAGSALELVETFRALAPALAVARLGCLAAGCCGGVPSELPWAIAAPGSGGLMHPVPLYEIVCWLVLAYVLRRAAERRVVPLFMIGFGAVRLIVQPLRTAPPLGEPWLPVEVLAAAWLAGGLWVWGRGGTGRRRGQGSVPASKDSR